MKKLTKTLKIDFEDEEDYRQFTDGMTLTDREFVELDDEDEK